MSDVRRSVLLSFAQRYTTLAVTVVSLAVLSRLLRPEEVGVFSLCAALVAIANVLRDFGISDYLIQEKELTRNRIRAAFTLALMVAWPLGLLLFLGRGLLADYYGHAGLRDVLAVLALNFALTPFGSPGFALLTREMRFGALYAIQASSSITAAVVAVVLAWLGHSYMSLAWSSVAGNLVLIAGVALFKARATWLLPGFQELRRVTGVGGFSMLAGVVNETTRNWHEFVIGRTLGFHALGLFSRGNGLVNQINTMVTGAALRVVSPVFAAKRRAGHELRKPYRRAVTLYTAIAWPLLAVLAFSTDPLILLLLGAQWTEVAPLARVLMVAQAIYILFAVAPTVLVATGHAKRRFKADAIWAAMSIPVVTVAAHFSLLAVAVAGIVTTTAAGAVYARELRAATGVTLGDTLTATWRSALVTAAVALCMSVVWTVEHWLLAHPLSQLVALGAGGAASWLLAVILLRHPLRRELQRLRFAVLRRLRARRAAALQPGALSSR
jgi:O-antigen/teichoic acid export membrane protein